MREWALRVLEQITEHKCVCCVYLYEQEKEDEAQSGLFLALELFTEGTNAMRLTENEGVSIEKVY